MLIDDSDSLVKFTLEGLFVVCKNERISPHRWEIGVPDVTCPDGRPHVLSIEIFGITGSGRPIIEPHTLDLTRPIEISTDVSAGLAVEYFEGSVFDGPRNVGDPKDSRWVIDLESRDFHDIGVEDKSEVSRHYKTKIFIDGGQLQTADRSVERYQRVNKADPKDVVTLGKLATAVGISLPRAANGSRVVTLRHRGGDPRVKFLPQREGLRYLVAIKHVCPPLSPAPTPPGTNAATDFDLYYKILRAKDHVEFKIEKVPAAAPPSPVTDAEAINPFGGSPQDFPSGGEEPQVCNVVLLRQTLQLPGI